METVTSSIFFDVKLSHEEIVAMRKLLPAILGKKVKFDVLRDAKLVVGVTVEVEKEQI